MADRNKLLNDLMLDEGYREKPYEDTVGKLTIGIGHNLSDRGLSHNVIMEIFNEDISIAKADLDHALPRWRTFTEPRQRALINMMFNLGLTRFRTFSRMLDAIHAGDWDTAAAEALDSKWAEQVGERAGRIAMLMRKG